MLQGLQSLLCTEMPQYPIDSLLLINIQVHWVLFDGLGVQAETKLWMRSERKNGPAVLKTPASSNQAEFTLLLRWLQPSCAGKRC